MGFAIPPSIKLVRSRLTDRDSAVSALHAATSTNGGFPSS